jgi:CBS domain-containing membrane protein
MKHSGAAGPRERRAAREEHARRRVEGFDQRTTRQGRRSLPPLTRSSRRFVTRVAVLELAGARIDRLDVTNGRHVRSRRRRTGPKNVSQTIFRLANTLHDAHESVGTEAYRIDSLLHEERHGVGKIRGSPSKIRANRSANRRFEGISASHACGASRRSLVARSIRRAAADYDCLASTRGVTQHVRRSAHGLRCVDIPDATYRCAARSARSTSRPIVGDREKTNAGPLFARRRAARHSDALPRCAIGPNACFVAGEKTMLTAHDLMTEDPTTVSLKATLQKAISVLQTLDVRHLPVVDEAGALVGMLSDRDVRGLAFPEILGAEYVGNVQTALDAPVSSMMSSNVLSVDVEADAAEIIDLMLDQKIGAVPVVDGDGALVGIVSYMDILRAISLDDDDNEQLALTDGACVETR